MSERTVLCVVDRIVTILDVRDFLNNIYINGVDEIRFVGANHGFFRHFEHVLTHHLEGRDIQVEVTANEETCTVIVTGDLLTLCNSFTCNAPKMPRFFGQNQNNQYGNSDPSGHQAMNTHFQSPRFFTSNQNNQYLFDAKTANELTQQRLHQSTLLELNALITNAINSVKPQTQITVKFSKYNFMKEYLESLGYLVTHIDGTDDMVIDWKEPKKI